MNKTFALLATLVVAVVCCVIAVKTYAGFRAQKPPLVARGAKLPGGYSKIVLGMKESEVVSLIGAPGSQTVNPKFEHKTPAQWADLESRAYLPSSDPSSVYGATPTLDQLKAGAEYSHRYHDEWLYKPIPTTFMTLYFGEDKSLLDIQYAPTGKGGAPGPMSH